MRVALDADGSGAFKEIDNPPVLTVLPGPAVEAIIQAPSHARPGSAFQAKIVLLDQYYNAATNSTASIRLTGADPAQLPARIDVTLEDKGMKRFPVTLNTVGFQQLRVEALNRICGACIPRVKRCRELVFKSFVPSITTTAQVVSQLTVIRRQSGLRARRGISVHPAWLERRAGG